MKTLFTSLALAATTLVSAQAINNPSFESWNINSLSYSTTDSVPMHWWTENCNTSFLTTDASDGNYAARVQGWMSCGIAPGVLINGNHPASGMYIDAGTPFAVKPSSISGYYKLTDVAAGDSAAVTIILKKYNTILHRPDTVAFGELALPATNTYSLYTVQLNDLMPNVQPDSIIFVFNSSKHYMVDVNTWVLPNLYVDQIKLQEAVTGIDDPQTGGTVLVYPNPAEEQVTIELDGFEANPSEILVSVLVGSGQTITKVHPDDNNRVVLNRGTLPAGVYLYRVEEGENVLATGEFIFK